MKNLKSGIRNKYLHLIVIFLVLLAPFSSNHGNVQAAPMQLPQKQGLSYPAQINKDFNPISIVAGEVSKLSVTIYNPNSFQIDNAAWTDNLVSIQPGILIADPVNINSDCGGFVTALAGQTTFSLNGGTVPQQVGATPGRCTVTIDVTSTTPGNLINNLPIGVLTGTGGGGTITNPTEASATLRVGSVQPPSLSKAFAPNTVFVGDISRLTITLRNNDLATSLTETSYTDNLPANVLLAANVNPVLNGCGSGTVTADPGTGTIILNNATVSPNSVCTVAVNVTSTTANTYPNSIPAGPAAGSISTKQGVTNATAAEATLAVQNVGITKAFSPTSIVAGAISNMTITIQNPTGSDYTGVILADTLPGDLIIAGAGTLTNCGAGVLEYPDGIDNTLTPGADERTVRLSGGTVPGSLNPPTPSNCVIRVPVTSIPNASATTWTNTINAGTLITDQLITNPSDVSANLRVTRWLTGTKAFSPASIPAGGTATVTITLRNNRTDTALTNVNFTDTLPADLSVFGTPAVNQCSGTVSFSNVPAPSTVTLSNGTIAASSTCTITFQVTASVVKNYTNTIPAGDISTGQGASNVLISSNSLSVVTAGGPVRVSKAFQTSPVSPGTVVRLRITITAPTDIAVSGITFTDVLPDGLDIVTSPAPSTNCSGGAVSTIITPVGPDSVTLTGGSIASANGTCRVDVYVKSDTAGSYPNTIDAGDITTTQGRTNTSASNTATLVVSGFTISKAFYPDSVNDNGYTTLTISLVNTSPLPITTVYLLDDLATMGGTVPTSGVYISLNPNAVTTTCTPGVLDFPDGIDNTLGANERKIRMTNGTIPAKVGTVDGLCTINVEVQGRGPSQSRTNTIPVANANGLISGAPISPRAPATAVLSIGSLIINVVKGFDPKEVTGGSASTLSVELINPNNTTLTGIAFTDNMPAGMFIADPPNFSVGACGGSLTGTVGAGTFSFSGGILPPASSCKLTLRVTTNFNGNLINVIPASTVTTNNGAVNPQETRATLTNLPGASVSKAFAPNPVTAGSGTFSVLTITIKNTGNIPLTGMGLTDTLPAGLKLAPAPAPVPVNNCGGTLTAAENTQLIELSGGSLAANADCTIVVSVNGPTPGNYQNCIAVNSLTNNENIQNKEAACDTLVVQGTPSLTLGKSLRETTFTTVGEVLHYEYLVKNSGNTNLDGPITVTDNKIANVVCPPVAVLAPGDSVTCTATYTVNAADVAAGRIDNIAVAHAFSGGRPVDSNTSAATISPITTLPGTGFPQGKTTSLPKADMEMAYADLGGIWLEVPRLNLKMPIVSIPIENRTWDVTWLGSKAGWLEGTAFPTWAGNSVITGHVWNADNTPGPFINLKKMGWGDEIIIRAWGQKYIYRVQSLLTIKPDALTQALKHEKAPWLTLLTCSDFNEKTNTYRYREIVRAVQVRIEPE